MPSKPRLLLVDDNTATLQVWSETLTPFARMRFVRSSAKTLKAVEADLPDLLILRINMPASRGLVVWAKLRALLASARLPDRRAADDGLPSTSGSKAASRGVTCRSRGTCSRSSFSAGNDAGFMSRLRCALPLAAQDFG